VFARYLALVFGTPAGGATNDTRQVAAGVLRGFLENSYETWAAEVQSSIRSLIAGALFHEDEKLRTMSCSLVATIVRRSSLASWPTLIPTIVGKLASSKTPAEVFGASLCLRLVSEDAP